MPRIEVYNTQVSAQTDIGGRRATPDDIGRAVDVFGFLSGAADDLMKVHSAREVDKVYAEGAKIEAGLAQDLAERSKQWDPYDTDAPAKWAQDANERFTQLQEGVSTSAGRRAYERVSSSVMGSMLQRANGLQAAAAGTLAKTTYFDSLNAARNVLVESPDQFDRVMEMQMEAIDNPEGGYSRHLPVATREQLKSQTRRDLAESAVQGEIRLDPDGALKRIEGGAWGAYLDADKTHSLTREARVEINARRYESERLEAAARRREVEQQRATENGFIAKLVEDPTSLSGAEISRSNMSPDDKIKWLGIVERSAKGERITTNADTFIGLWERIHLPDDNPNKLRDESELTGYLGRGLTVDNINTLRNEISGKRTPEGQMEADLKKGLIDFAKSSLTGTNNVMGWRDPKGDEQLQRFMSFFLPEYQRQRAAGKSALDLLDPNSKDYLGRAIDRYKRSAAQMMQDRISGLGEVGMPLPTGAAEPNVIPLPSVATPKDKAEYDALAPGTHYRAPDGKVRVKGGPAAPRQERPAPPIVSNKTPYTNMDAAKSAFGTLFGD